MKFILLFLTGCSVVSVHAQTITTFAGTGTAGYNGDFTGAALAQLNHPFGVVVNQAGDIYIADRVNSRVRKVNSTGIISTVAGTGVAGYNGDTHTATATEVNDVTGVAVDRHGNVYIADKGNNRIRKVDTGGTVITVAGNGTAAYSGDGGPATAASLNSPRRLAVDTFGNIYVADQGNNRVRKINNAGLISTIAGTTAAGYNGDNIPATAAQLNGPYDIAMDTVGNIYVADVDNYRIRKIDNAGMITTYAGNGTVGFSGDGGPATAAQLKEAIGVAIDEWGNLFIADAWNARIRWVDRSGIINTIAGNGVPGYSGDGGAPLAAQFNNPYGLALTASGDLFVADYDNSRIRRIVHPLGTKEPVSLPHTIKVYPNPGKGIFFFLIPGYGNVKERVTVTDVTGRVVKDLLADSNRETLLTLDTPGMYFMRLGNDTHALKLIVE